jgi:hypothetical protein
MYIFTLFAYSVTKRKTILPTVCLNRLKAKLDPNPLHNSITLNIAVFELKERTNATSALCVHLRVSILLPGARIDQSCRIFRKITPYLTVNTQLLHYKCGCSDTQMH